MRILWSVLALFWTFSVMAQNFLPATEDIPLMDGLYQIEETATFDSPAERMTIISAQSHKTSQQISQFYHQVLINLGWTEKQTLHYVRGSDALTLEITPTTNKENTIQFTLVQKN